MRLLLCLILGLLAADVSAFECKFTAERALDIDAASARALLLKLDSSDARVRGVAGLAKIEVHGKACASEQRWLDELTIDQRRDGERVVVAPHQPERHGTWFGTSYAYIDLDVRMPARLALQIESNSGDADVADVAALDFATSSGDLLASRINGALGVEVASGDVKADDIGSLDLRRSGSGDVRAVKVHGEVKVGHVGSGDLGFDDVQSGVHVGSVGSGDVRVARTGGDCVIESIGSGDVSASEIGGDFVVKSHGSGDIHHRAVKGKVHVPDDDGDWDGDQDRHG